MEAHRHYSFVGVVHPCSCIRTASLHMYSPPLQPYVGAFQRKFMQLHLLHCSLSRGVHRKAACVHAESQYIKCQDDSFFRRLSANRAVSAGRVQERGAVGANRYHRGGLTHDLLMEMCIPNIQRRTKIDMHISLSKYTYAQAKS